MSGHHDCELLVIGSGAGGAPTAALLAEAGRDVLVVEEGAWVDQDDVVPFSLDQMERQYRSAGLTVALGRPSIAYTEGRCAGGGTEINSGLWRRPSEPTLERWCNGWSIRDLDPGSFFDRCDEIESALSVQPVPGSHHPAGERLRLGAERLGWSSDESPRWMTYPTEADAAADRSVASQGRRQTMTRTYLPRALSAGARMLCEHRVDRLVIDQGRAFRAELTGPEGDPVTVDFERVVVCAGAIQTPALLQRSGCRRLIGRRLAVHPTVKLAARFDERVNGGDDVPVHQITEFAPELCFGGSASHPGLVALSLVDGWDTMRPHVSEWPNMAVFYAAITSEGRGRVRSIPGFRDPLVHYRLTRRDRALLGSGLTRLARIMLEAGATEVFPSMPGAPIVRTRNDLGRLDRLGVHSTASVMSVHLCSTVPMGEDESVAAADSFGRVHGTQNVWVNDASLLPDAPGVNPQASVMSIAVRNARRLAAAGS